MDDRSPLLPALPLWQDSCRRVQLRATIILTDTARKEAGPVCQVSRASSNADPIGVVTMEEVVRKMSLLSCYEHLAKAI